MLTYISKTTVVGLLLCLTCLYFMPPAINNSIFIAIGGYGFPVGVCISLWGLFKKEDTASKQKEEKEKMI